jgi:hypothetical protein
VKAELEALRSLASRIQDLVMGDVDRTALLATSMSAVAELHEGWIDAAVSNAVRWGSHLVLVITVSHFLELDTNQEVLGAGRNRGLTEGEADTLWSQVRTATDSLASHVPPSVAHNPPNSVGE